MHTKLVPIKQYIVTASGISVIIMKCFIILSLFNPVLIFKIAFAGSALIPFLNFNFATFIWLNTPFISALECVAGSIKCVAQNKLVFLYGFSSMASPYKHTSVQYATVPVTFCNTQLSNAATGIQFSQ